MFFREHSPPPEERHKAPEEMKAYTTFDPTYHPGLAEEDLCHKLYSETIKDNRKAGKEYAKTKIHPAEGEFEVLCHSCGWNERHETLSSYTSRVKVHHARQNIGLWNIGTNWMLRDEPNDATLGNAVDAMEFLNSKSTTIPVPTIIRLSDPTEKFQFSLMTRAQGDPLHNVYHTYTAEQRKSIAKQLGGYVRQWRQFTAPRAQKVNGEQLHDILVGTCNVRAPECKRIGYTRDEWLESLSPELRKGLTMQDKTLEQDPYRLEERLKDLKESFPDCGPYVFTHGDLNPSNIIVQDGIITGIVDWERAGFYPWWVEAKMFLGVLGNRYPGLFNYITEDLCPGYNRTTFLKNIATPVRHVRDAFEASPRLHRGDENEWLRRPFCKCKPYRSRIQQRHMGVAPTHEIADKDPQSTKESIDRFLAGLQLPPEEETGRSASDA